MSDKLVRIKNRYDIAENWNSDNPVLAKGEIGIDSTNNIIKVGNGIDNWKLLKPVTGGNNSKLFSTSKSNIESVMFIHTASYGDATPYWIFTYDTTSDRTDSSIMQLNSNVNSINFILFVDGFVPSIKQINYVSFASETIEFDLIPLANASITYDDMPKLALDICKTSDNKINIFEGFEILKTDNVALDIVNITNEPTSSAKGSFEFRRNITILAVCE